MIKFVFLLFVLFLIAGCSQSTGQATSEISLQDLCKSNGNMFMKMPPTIDGVRTGEPACAGCMIGMSHYCTIEEYQTALNK